MEATLIDGKAIAKEIHTKTAARVATLHDRGIHPKLAVVLVGDDLPSHTYVRMKGKAAARVGMDFSLFTFPADMTQDELNSALADIQSDETLVGLIVQLPLPPQLSPTETINRIKPELDIDCLTDVNFGKLVMETNPIVAPTPGAVMAILEKLTTDVAGKHVTIVGTGHLVGKPLAIIMMNRLATVTTCNIETPDLKEQCLKADILVSAVGKKDLIRGDMVKDGAIVIDAGVDFENNQMFGDVNVAEVSEKASHVTPTPGGVGPLTVARLLHNVVVLAEESYRS